MARKGYKSITLDNKTVKDIDNKIDLDNEDMNSRPKVIKKGIEKLEAQQ